TRLKKWFAWCRDQFEKRSRRERWIIGGVAGCCMLLIVSAIVYATNRWTSPSQDPDQTGPGLILQAKSTSTDVGQSATPPPKQAKEFNSEEINAHFGKAVALIETPFGYSSGFLIGPNLVATNAQGIEHVTLSSLKVSFPSAPPEQKPRPV